MPKTKFDLQAHEERIKSMIRASRPAPGIFGETSDLAEKIRKIAKIQAVK